MKTATTNDSRNKKLIRRLRSKIKSPPRDTCKNKYEESRKYVPRPDKQFK